LIDQSIDRLIDRLTAGITHSGATAITVHSREKFYDVQLTTTTLSAWHFNRTFNVHVYRAYVHL